MARSSASKVMATAKTPSLNASNLPLLIDRLPASVRPPVPCPLLLASSRPHKAFSGATPGWDYAITPSRSSLRRVCPPRPTRHRSIPGSATCGGIPSSACRAPKRSVSARTPQSGSMWRKRGRAWDRDRPPSCTLSSGVRHHRRPVGALVLPRTGSSSSVRRPIASTTPSGRLSLTAAGPKRLRHRRRTEHDQPGSR